MRIFLLILLSVVTISCCKTNDPKPVGDPKVRTVLVYMVADNNLYNYALTDMNEMERAWDDKLDGTVLVYMNPRSTTIPSRLYKIRKDDSGEIKSEIIKDYGVRVNACSPSVLSSVIADARELAPAEDFGLVLWSHGTGWLPKGMPEPRSVGVNEQPDRNISYSFGGNDTYGDEMNINELASALPSDIKMNFIAFDACYMSTIEVSYELRNKAKYIIASTSETPAFGFPYDEIIPDMVEADVRGIAKKTYDFCNSRSGWEQTCSISVVDCSKLPAVAESVKQIVTSSIASLPGDINSIQRFSVNAYYYQELFFDLADFINKTWSGSEKLVAFNNAMEQAYFYKAHTPFLLYPMAGSRKVDTFSGVSAHIPLAKYPASLNYYKNNFAWSADSGLGSLSL